MIKVKEENYKNFYKIFEEMNGRIGILGVLDGICKGLLYSDSENNPETAVLLTSDGHILAGNPYNSEFNKELFQLFKTDVVRNVSHIAMREKWVESLKTIFQSHISDPIKRYFYYLNEIDFQPNGNKLDAEYKIFKVTPESLSTLKDYKNFKNVNNMCLSYWNAYKPSKKYYFGYVVIKDKTILSRCSLCQESTSQNICELDIETEKEYRKQGFAFAAAHATIKEAFRVGYDKVAWGCDASNTGSWKTAEKLGFVKQGDNYLSWLKKKIENEENDKDDSCI